LSFLGQFGITICIVAYILIKRKNLSGLEVPIFLSGRFCGGGGQGILETLYTAISFSNSCNPCQVTSYRSLLSQRCSVRNSWASYSLKSDRKQVLNGKSDFRILDDWNRGHVSLKDSIDQAKKNDRPSASAHRWKLPEKLSDGWIDVAFITS